jgi:hypothetical protein
MPKAFRDANAAQDARDALRSAIVLRGNVDGITGTTAADIDFLLNARNQTATWVTDLDVNGVVDNTDVNLLIRHVLLTEYGDTNIDGRVDINDFAALVSAFNQPGGWAQGSFDGNGTVDIADFAVMVAQYNWVSTGIEPAYPSTLRGVGSVIPEPATLGLVALTPLLLRRRRG